ncbi:MAG TPA: anthranilate phosphoribosyltransferase [Bryobacteraceae bacterium]|nr:anthranilate phosphoribosyltransferase [Bryobacteraceae bacterium]
MSLLPFLHRVAAGGDLPSDEAYRAMSVLLEGLESESVIAAFLVALKMKGETAAELAGFARAMRERMVFVDAHPGAVDTCGTGGDGSGTFNISTIAALVMAGAGARVAKHGNRSLSSRSGSADLLEALGVRISMTPEEAAWAVREIGIGFLFAPNLHPAMKHAQPVRRALKMRTVFNLLGPLANPARARKQLIGAPSPEAARLMAEALSELGSAGAFVVHGHDGLDEVSTTGPTEVWMVCGGKVEKLLWTPADFGVKRASLDALAGGDAAENARIAREILAGERGPARDIVLVNAAAGLLIAGISASLRDGMETAARAIDSGSAAERLALLQKKFPHL